MWCPLVGFVRQYWAVITFHRIGAKMEDEIIVFSKKMALERVNPISKDEYVELIKELVHSGEPTWSTILEVNGEKIKQSTAKERLKHLEKWGYLKSESKINSKNVPRREYTPTLQGASFVFSESYKKIRPEDEITADVLEDLETLTTYSSIILACSRTPFWGELMRLNDGDGGLKKEELHRHFLNAVFVAANSLQNHFVLKGSNCGRCTLHKDEDEGFTIKFIESWLMHTIYYPDANDIEDKLPNEILLTEIIPALSDEIDTATLIRNLSNKLEEYQQYSYLYGVTIEELEKY